MQAEEQISFPAAFEFLSTYSEAKKNFSHFRNQIDKKRLIGIDEMDIWILSHAQQLPVCR